MTQPMGEPRPDAARAYRVLDLIDAHSEALDMYVWVEGGRQPGVTLADLTTDCGTVACFAGWTVAEAGYRTRPDGEVFGPDGLVGHVAALAADLLGLDGYAADSLFCGTEGDHLHKKVAELFGPRPDGA